MVRLLAARAGLPMASALAILGLMMAQPAAAGDAGHGKNVFAAQCSMCHSAGKATILGPPLAGVVGRKAGSVPGYAYSPAMKAAGFTWTDAQLHTYLPSPKGLVPGTKMSYMGLKNPDQLDDLIAYLDTLK